MTGTLLPPVGYRGGKRRLLPRLRPLLPADAAAYAEPWAGMAACYLDLRARGFRGPAVLAESNEPLRDVWALLHSPSGSAGLLAAARSLPEPSEASWEEISAAGASDTADRAARFLWITNASFGNNPPSWTGSRWRCNGTKVRGMAKWGHKFRWSSCTGRLEACAEALRGLPCEILPDAANALDGCARGWFVYADPPYAGTASYGARQARQAGADYLPLLLSAEARGARIVLSEKSDLRASLPGWSADAGVVANRVSHGLGANGTRREWVLASPAQ